MRHGLQGDAITCVCAGSHADECHACVCGGACACVPGV
jgi:hypothetical protein